MRKLFIIMISLATLSVSAQGITEEMLQTFKHDNQLTPSELAIRRAVGNVDINTLCLDGINANSKEEPTFSDQVKTKGITNQKQSGRCWLFTGLNVIRARAIDNLELNELYLSPMYLFFFDQLEKSNLFLQSIIDTRSLPDDDRKVEWMMKYPINDGGTYTGVADLVAKYGVVPQNAVPENFSSNNTARLNMFITLKLREYALELRSMPAKTKEAALLTRKKEMLSEVYHILSIVLGEPVESFEWTRHDKDGKALDTKQYTPKEFAEFILNGDDYVNDYVMLMNDPSREYYKLYEIDNDRHLYDGHNWLYVNVPIEEFKSAATASIKDNRALYIGCDVGKFYNSQNGWLDINNYNYEDLLGVKFNMNKEQRVKSFTSGSSHAMTLIAVDIDPVSGEYIKWMVENSWGTSKGHKGYLIMTDEWFEQYMFRLVVKKDYLSEKVLNCLNSKPIMLPMWDPMFASEE